MGNVTRDVVVKTLPSGQKVTDIGLAVNRTYTQNNEKKEEVTFVDITFWGKQAEVLGQYVTKGKPLFVEGRLKYDTWEEPQGTKHSKLRVYGEHFQFIGSREKDGGSIGNMATPETTSAPTPSKNVSAGSRSNASKPTKASKQEEPSYDDFDSNISDDEIPF